MIFTIKSRIRCCCNFSIHGLLILCISCFFALTTFAQPVIVSFAPSTGPVGTRVTLTGNNFDPTASNNVVYFGAVKAAVTNASSSSLTVIAPTGSSFSPISVTVNNLTAYSQSPYLTTFPGTDTAFVPSSFYSKTDFGLNGAGYGKPFGVVLSDFDGDGKPDLLLPNTEFQTYATIKQNLSTPGNISFGPELDYEIQNTATGAAVGDFDGDGKPDIAVASDVYNQLNIFRNTSTPGQISFSADQTYQTGTEPFGVTAQDLDGDGRPDLIVTSYGTNIITIFRNTSTNGNISFADTIDFLVATTPQTVICADFDGDGKPDIAVSCIGSDSLVILKNISTSSGIAFAPRISYATGNYPRWVVAADFDKDGKPDLAVSNQNSNTISIFRNISVNGTISFAPKDDYSTLNAPYGLAAGDLDGDGYVDLVAPDGQSDSVSVFRNISSPGLVKFSAKVNYATGGGPLTVAIGDIDGDGKPEIITANSVSSISILRNKVNEPVITSFSPDTAYTDTTLVISGLNLSSVTSVTLGGVPVDTFKIISPTKISAIVGAGASGSLNVTSPYGTGSRAGFVFLPPPFIFFLLPAEASAGSAITIYGENFVGIKNISIGGVAVQSYQLLFSNSIQAIVPFGAQTGFCVIETAGGKDSTNFTLLQPPAISGVTPLTGPVGTSVTITGSNFTDISTGKNYVSFGAVLGTITTADSNSITVTIPAGATNSPISVLANGLAGYWGSPFITTFPGAAAAFSSTSFGLPFPLAITQTPSNILISDLNGDGKPDLVTAQQNYITLFPNTCTIDSLGFSTQLSYYTEFNITSLLSADLNGDGKPDLIACPSSNQAFTLLLNTSTSQNFTFLSQPIIGDFSSTQFQGAATADIDGDGKPDLVVINSNPNTLDVYRNISTASSLAFGAKKEYPLSFIPGHIAISDLDQDGKPDLVITNSSSNSFSIFKNISTPGFPGLISSINQTLNDPATNLAISDVNADGKPDLIIASYSPSDPAGSSVSILKNTSISGSITLSSAISYTIGGNIGGLSIADLDGDGKPDISFLRPDSNQVSILKNITGSAISFASPVNYSIGSSPANSCLGDLDGDGKTEIIITSNSAKSVVILRNQVGEPIVTPAGINPVTGTVIKTTYEDSTVQTYSSHVYVQRHYDIDPQSIAANSTATITLFFSQTDFNNFNIYPGHGADLPQNPIDSAGISALRIFQYHGFSATGSPASYGDAAFEINPLDSNIVWNAQTQMWQVTFSVTGFSGFFVGTGVSDPLPLLLISFSGQAQGIKSLLSWQTENEIDVKNFQVQRATDGKTFSVIGTVPALNGRNSQTYQFVDSNDNYLTSYYRLQIMNIDGSSTYSNIVVLNQNKSQALRVSPNPSKNLIQVWYPLSSKALIQIFSITGQLLMTREASGNNTTVVDISNLSSGIYKIRWQNGIETLEQSLLKN